MSLVSLKKILVIRNSIVTTEADIFHSATIVPNQDKEALVGLISTGKVQKVNVCLVILLKQVRFLMTVEVKTLEQLRLVS